MSPIPVRTAESIEQHVCRLLKTWRDETAYLSSSTTVTGHPAYRELITLGSVALPFLFQDLEKTGDGHLSQALTAITQARPIPNDERGQVRKAAETWLCWARENGYQW